MQIYPALKRNELPGREKTWKNLKCILLMKEASLCRLYTL